MQLKKFLFDSTVKRMGCVVRFESGKGAPVTRVLCKGAPEVL